MSDDQQQDEDMRERRRAQRALLHPLFVDAAECEIARAARTTVDVVRAERERMERDSGLAALLERAAEVERATRPLGASPVPAAAFLDSLLDRALAASEKGRLRAAMRVLREAQMRRPNGIGVTNATELHVERNCG